MFGYLKTRPHARADNFGATTDRELRKYQRLVLGNARSDQSDQQSTSYLSWESISYFFGKWTTNDGPSAPPLGKMLEETRVDSNITKAKKQPLGGKIQNSMEKTMEYTVTSYDTLPKIALKFDVTPSELTRLNRLAIRTLYPGQILQVPCPKPTSSCSECTEAVAAEDCTPKSMTMNHHHADKQPVAKRVSFDDINADVVETFIKVKSKYITDGQGVVKGFLLITPHAVIFHPDVSEILVVDRGAEYYQVHFPMQSVCAAGMFDDIASMAFHDALLPGHFFLDKPLMELLGDSSTVFSEEELKEDESSSTLQGSLSTSREDESVESITGASENLASDGGDEPTTVTSPETGMIKDILSDVLEDVDKKIAGVQDEVETNFACPSEDVVVSSSSHSGLTNDDNHHSLSSDTEQLSYSPGHAHRMNSTPKLAPYKGPGDDRHDPAKGYDRDSDGHSYSEGISRDSGIGEHLSHENVQEDSITDDHHYDSKLWMESFRTNRERASVDMKEIIPMQSTCHVDMPKYLCAKIKKGCWPELRPRLCRHAHEAIQRANDERREFWFSIPTERVLDVYGFFLEWCPAIHDGETDEETSDVESDLVGSCGSDYSVITMSEIDEGFKLVDNFFSKSPDKEKKVKLGRKRLHSREKRKKKKPEPKEVQRKPSSWSICSIEEPLVPEMVGKSEILTESDVLQLSQRLPSRTIGHSWRLIYSTYLHGISLKTLYRTLAEYDNPALLVIKDESQKVFGAFASSPFAVSEHYYGTGECFLYSFCPELKVFRWSGENNFFIKGDIDSLAFGGGEGNFGLWLDEDLYHGSSHHCKTFDNEPLTITRDFLCCGVETWCFE